MCRTSRTTTTFSTARLNSSTSASCSLVLRRSPGGGGVVTSRGARRQVASAAARRGGMHARGMSRISEELGTWGVQLCCPKCNHDEPDLCCRHQKMRDNTWRKAKHARPFCKRPSQLTHSVTMDDHMSTRAQEGGLNLLHEADDDAVIWLESRPLQHSRNNSDLCVIHTYPPRL